jgi:hypothetical protein
VFYYLQIMLPEFRIYLCHLRDKFPAQFTLLDLIIILTVLYCEEYSYEASNFLYPPVASSLFIHSSVVLQPILGPWPLLQFRNLFTQTVGLLGRGISPSQGRYLHTGPHKHPCLEWDSKPRSQRSSEGRPP